ncbi:hypothetical protein LTR08_005551 [Meristemomyces frigidus]|nr:hypothetical protein LTR08_005551 [Meristemomyces frigidus]
MKNTLLLLTNLFLASLAVARTSPTAKATTVPTILEDPLLHLGFAWKDTVAWTGQAAKDVKSELDKVDLGDAGKWINQAGADAGSWVSQAAKDVKAETDKIDLTVPNGWIHKASASVQYAIENTDSDFGKWLKQASKDVGLNNTLNDLQAVKLEEFPSGAFQYIKDNPKQTTFHIINGVAFFSPALVYGPLLGVLGFGAGGVRAASLATRLHSQVQVLEAVVPPYSAD